MSLAAPVCHNKPDTCSHQEGLSMLKNGFGKGTQWQRAPVGWTLAESRRGCSWSRRHCFFILLLGVVLFLYNINNEMVPNWNTKFWRNYNAKKWWTSFQKETVVSPRNTAASSSHMTENNSPAAPQTSSNGADRTQQTTNQSWQNSTKPVKSPYLVEYPYKYRFIINEPQKCEQDTPFLVLVVPVGPNNRAHRDVVRKTWGGESSIMGKVVTLVFLLGLQSGEGAEQLQEQLLQEGRDHHDLIQSDFLDCYKNLTIKTMVMMEWLDAHCSNALYAMKIDSDMFLNVPNLVNMLLKAPKTNYMTGLVERSAIVHRDPKSKWYVPVEVYPHSEHPPYALGLGYVFSLDLPKKLVEASRNVIALYIEDVFLGLCMQHLGISPTDPPNWSYFNVSPVPYSRCAYSKLIATTTHEYTDRMKEWKDFKKPGPYC